VSWRNSFVLLLLATAAALGQSEHQHHPPQSSDEYARVLNDPARDAWQKPHDVVMALALRPDEVIADIGAGTGYFSRRFARHAGKVYAVDIDAKLLAIADEGAPANQIIVKADPDDPKLADASVDTLFFCDVWHHIEGRPAYLKKLDRALKPGGRIVMIDFHRRPAPVGPPLEMKISAEELIGELSAAGFRKTEEFDILPHQYFLIFERK
jgi:arsenite methyltransferase